MVDLGCDPVFSVVIHCHGMLSLGGTLSSSFRFSSSKSFNLLYSSNMYTWLFPTGAWDGDTIGEVNVFVNAHLRGFPVHSVVL